MFQPEVKRAFVERYCPPAAGWRVFVDVDPSELGLTGGPRLNDAAVARQRAMRERGAAAKAGLEAAGVTVGGSRRAWFDECGDGTPTIPGDRDVIAIHGATRRILIAEVEGASSGQPEAKLYKAIGQLVTAVDSCDWRGYVPTYVLAVHGRPMIAHLRRAAVLRRLGISAVHIAEHRDNDEWIFRVD